MKKTLLILASIGSVSSFARPNTANMTCKEAKSFIKERGAVVMSTGPSHIYDRFVAHGFYCYRGEQAEAAYRITQDQKKCRIGYVCRDYQNN